MGELKLSQNFILTRLHKLQKIQRLSTTVADLCVQNSKYSEILDEMAIFGILKYQILVFSPSLYVDNGKF